VLAVRVLGPLNEGTVYTYALLLAVYLVGSAAGAALYQRGAVARQADRTAAEADALQSRLLMLLAAACLLGTAGLYAAESAKALLRQTLGTGMPAALGTEAGLAILVFALPTVAMGALFSHLANRALASGLGLGRALGVNTLGAAVAPLLFGLVAVPAWGPKAALLLIAAGYLALALPAAWNRRPTLAAGIGLIGLIGLTGLTGALLAALIWAPPLAFVEVPEGGRIVSYRDGAMAAVSVVEDVDGVSRLRIDNRQQEGSSATRLFDARQALLPLLLHPAPQRALFLGLGTGVTASSAAAAPNLEVDAVELLPEVIEASAHFRSALPGGADNPRLHLLAADARRYVRATDRRYGLIVADNFHPARSGSGALYTVEHFQAVRARLNADGVFCQWLPLHQLDLATLRSIVRSFTAVYPGGWALLANNSLETPVVGLVGRADGGRFDAQQVRGRVAELAGPLALADFGLVDEFAALGGFIAGPASLAQFAASADLNTDDRPVVAYRAPRIAYAPDSTPASRLLALLQASRIEPAELIAPPADAAWAPRLAAYWRARDGFIALGQGIRPSADVRQMLQQVQAPLLAVLRTSPDFRPAYDPLLRMARALARSDADAGRALLDELVRVQPARPEAALALRELGSAGR
jgi:spermidine synthase